ncbi:MAG: gamma-glutamyl-gamma-aminobutyrate hydrolase family protein [Oligoflexia bacterium]|nr:gamma-glutamyl-gamma-aminobutyrate hydrolase family protein [Oligoflexia bacterium]
MLRIGVTAAFIYPGANIGRDKARAIHYRYNSLLLHYLQFNSSEVASEPVQITLIPNHHPDHIFTLQAMEDLIASLDGIVFQGGDDIDPTSYQEDYLDKEQWPGDRHRDDYELKIAELALKHHIPLLGICRGFQLLNVAHGGTLYQDLKTQLPHAIKHQDKETRDQNTHAIKWVDQEWKRNIFPDLLEEASAPLSSYDINSVHHQGVKKLGHNLTPLAISPEDGLIEAYYRVEPWVLAFQWHPEYPHHTSSKLLPADPIKKYFFQICLRVKKQS